MCKMKCIIINFTIKVLTRSPRLSSAYAEENHSSSTTPTSRKAPPHLPAPLLHHHEHCETLRPNRRAMRESRVRRDAACSRTPAAVRQRRTRLPNFRCSHRRRTTATCRRSTFPRKSMNWRGRRCTIIC